MAVVKPILVIKFGTASITRPSRANRIRAISFAEIARQVAMACTQAYRIILVSSGAVGAGKSHIPALPRYTFTQRKAAAADRQSAADRACMPRHFSPYQIAIAQSLCERQHFANRHQFLQLKSTYEELWASGIIPIVNENDVVSDRELKFSDNDELATLIATGFRSRKRSCCVRRWAG